MQDPQDFDTETPKHISQSCLQEFVTFEEAQAAAAAAAAATGGRVSPCVVFIQTDRVLLSTACPITALETRLKPEPVRPGVDASKARNRPVDVPHAKEIANYVAEQYPNYILPAITATYSQPLAVYTIKSGLIRMGFYVVPDGCVAEITDGMHRFYGLVGGQIERKKIVGALQLRPEIAKDSIALLITIENEIDRAHQDFVDMAQSQRIQKSLLTDWDLRDPLNKMVRELIDQVPLFKGRVEKTAKSITLTKTNRNIIMSQHVRSLILSAVNPDCFGTKPAASVLTTETETQSVLGDLVLLLDTMTENVPGLKEILAIDPAGPQAGLLPGLRLNLILPTWSGMVICGMTLKVIREFAKDEAERARLIKALATEIDWTMPDKVLEGQPEDPIWHKGGLIDPRPAGTGKGIQRGRAPVLRSATRIMVKLGLPVPPNFTKYLAPAPAKAA